MKHTPKITLILLALFFVTQLIGLKITSYYLKTFKTVPQGTDTAFLPLMIMILLATLLALLLFRFKLFRIWKIWFLLSIWFMLSLSLSVFIPDTLAVLIAAVLAALKVYRPSVILHNFTELFIYGALAAIIVPLLNVISASALLIGISVYDYVAVRKTGHMIKLAKAQSEEKTFAGLAVPYGKSLAILGGGDLGFALIFAGVVMKRFSLSWFSLGSMIVPLCTMMSLAFLFYMGEKKKFYPAMPYISIGAFVGYGIVWLLNLTL